MLLHGKWKNKAFNCLLNQPVRQNLSKQNPWEGRREITKGPSGIKRLEPFSYPTTATSCKLGPAAYLWGHSTSF
jgi:hypothetical protein